MMQNPNTVKYKKLKALPFLALEDMNGKSEADVRAHIESTFDAPGATEHFEVLVAYESVGDYGCDSSNWFLLRDKRTGELFENHGSHCSCYGFESQWKPEVTTRKYLKSDKFGGASLGGYDSTRNYDDKPDHNTTIREWIKKNL